MKLLYKAALVGCFTLFNHQPMLAQTDIDAIMMEKNAFCAGGMFMHSQWKNYWEGTLKRDNANLGIVSAQTYGIMGNYGVSQKLNLLFNLPYVKTKASAGTMAGMKGLQDLSLFLKYRPFSKQTGFARLSLYGMAGFSTPVSQYTADYLPLSIGLRSRTLMGRIMADYHYDNRWFGTASATYVRRSNIKLDRTAYYTDQLILSNEVAMPDAFTFNIRAGFRNQWLIAEAVVNNWTTLGGFDITRNNMPFASNRMNATSAGANFKYVFKKIPQLSLTGGASQIIGGRNMGQSLNINGGIFYVLDFSKKTSQPEKK
jgi:hypothetical protein